MPDTADGCADDDLEKRQLLAQLQHTMFGRRECVELGRYALEERLGSGAMGVVFVANDPQLRRKIALKVLHTDRIRDPTDSGHRRLTAEARALGQLTHPNVIRVFDVGRAGGRVYFAMELVPGVSLEKWLDAEVRAWPRILELFVQAGRGLQAAHEAGVVHRDFKPSNVQVGEDGRVRVLDFGLAKALRPLPSSESPVDLGLSADEQATVDGCVVGTPRYMAPQQLRGGIADPLADQYAYCTALFEALHGEPPFDSANMLGSKLSADRLALRPRSSVPIPIQAAVIRGLSPSPGDRFATIAELIDHLNRNDGKRRKMGAAVAAAAVSLVAGAVLWSKTGSPTAPQVPQPLRSQTPTPTQDTLSPWVLQTRAELGVVRALLDAQKFEAARVLSRVLLQRAETIGDATLLTEARLYRAELLVTLEMPGAVELLEAAHAQALHNRDDSLRVQAAILLAQIAKGDPTKRKELVRWVADARTEGAELTPRQQYELGRLDVAAAQGLTGAVEAAQRLVVLARTTWGERGPNVALALMTLGDQLIRIQRIDEARAALDEAVEIELDAEHPDYMLLGAVYFTRSMVEGLDAARNQDDPAIAARAIEYSRKAEGAYARVSGRDGQAAISARINTAQLLVRAHRYQDARHTLEPLLPLVDPDGTDASFALETLGTAQFELGELEDAQGSLERAVIVIESARGATHPALASTLYRLARVQEGRGRVIDARKTFERSVELARQAGPGAVATATEGLANLELSAGNFARAAELYDQAGEAWAKIAGPESSQVDNVRKSAASARAQIERDAGR